MPINFMDSCMDSVEAMIFMASLEPMDSIDFMASVGPMDIPWIHGFWGLHGIFESMDSLDSMDSMDYVGSMTSKASMDFVGRKDSIWWHTEVIIILRALMMCTSVSRKQLW